MEVIKGQYHICWQYPKLSSSQPTGITPFITPVLTPFYNFPIYGRGLPITTFPFPCNVGIGQCRYIEHMSGFHDKQSRDKNDRKQCYIHFRDRPCTRACRDKRICHCGTCRLRRTTNIDAGVHSLHLCSSESMKWLVH